MKLFAMSDIHGFYIEFIEALELVDLENEDTMLLILGDFIHGGPGSYQVIEKIISLQEQYGDRVVALIGNHEELYLRNRVAIAEDDEFDEIKEDKYRDWIADLPRYYATDNQIFCHAGVNEEAGESWEWDTDDFTYTEKYPAQLGSFCMDIIAGHIYTSDISGDRGFYDIFYDGENHYYIDGCVCESGKIPVLMVDTETNKYYRVTENGEWLVEPYEEW